MKVPTWYLILPTLFIVVGFLAVQAGTMSLEWGPVSPQPAKYAIYSGPSSGQYDSRKEVDGTVTATVIPVLDCANTAAAVKAVNSEGEESLEFSNEVQGWGRPIVVSAAPQAFKIPQGNQTYDYPVTIEGVNFQPGATVEVPGSSAQIVNPVTVSCRKITATLRVDNTVALGIVDVEVVNPDSVFGTGSSLLTFFHGPPPVGGLSIVP
jgi:hypothetical protein